MAESKARPITPQDATLVLDPLHPVAGKHAIYLIRHGHTEYNETGRSSIDKIRGWIDIPLDKGGIDGAEIIGEMTRPLGIEVIACSDLKRAVQTAEIIGKMLELPISAKTPAFRPWNLGSDIQGKPTKEVMPLINYYLEDTPNEAPPDGESFNDFKNRFLSGIRSIINLIEKGRMHRVAIITHFRGVKLAQSWIAAGGENNYGVNTKNFTKNDLKPCAIIELNPTADSDNWEQKVLFHGFFNVRGKILPAGPGS